MKTQITPFVKISKICLRTNKQYGKPFLQISIDQDICGFVRFLWVDDVFLNEPIIA